MPENELVREASINRPEILRRLIEHRVPAAAAQRAVSLLPDGAVGIILYGSFARGDEGPESDIDLVVVTGHRIQPPADDELSLSSYTPAELVRAAGSLFAYHLRRDGVALHGADSVRALLKGAVAPDAPTLLARIRRLAPVLRARPENVAVHLPGLVRVAKYLLRSAMYAEAIHEGEPSFSVSELAARASEPRLAQLLSSHSAVAPEPTTEVLTELRERLERIVGPIAKPASGTLEAMSVVYWDDDRDLARLAILAAGGGQDVPYDLLGRVIL